MITDQHPASASDVLLDAKVALQTAAEDGTDAVAVFDRDKRGMSVPSVTVRRLATAVDEDELSLRYLLVTALADDRVVATRALLRWDDPHGGTVTPDRFATALETSGLVVPVGRWVLRTACRQAAAWSVEASSPPVQVMVDVSPRQLLQSDLIETIDDTLAATGLDPTRLCLVVADSALLVDVEPAWAALREVRARQVRLALAGFGTASASLSHLRRFRVDLITIPADFVATGADNDEDEVVLTQVVGLAHALGLEALAEDVRAPAQIEVLRRAGCDLAHGDAIAPEGTAEELAGRMGW